MKQLSSTLLLITAIIGIASCTKEESAKPETKTPAIDFRTELKKSDWRYVSIEDWKFLDDTRIEAKSGTTTRIHTYNIINDSFILTTNYFGSVNTVPYPNLKLSNDTIYWRYSNIPNYNVFLIRKK